MCFQVPEVEAAQDEAAGPGGGAGSGALPSREEKERFLFEERMIRLDKACAVCLQHFCDKTAGVSSFVVLQFL